MAKKKPISAMSQEILVIVPDDEKVRGLWRSQSINISVENLKDGIAEFASLISRSLDGLNSINSKLSLEEVTLTATVTAKGKLALFGSGVETAGSGGLTFKFKVAGATRGQVDAAQ